MSPFSPKPQAYFKIFSTALTLRSDCETFRSQFTEIYRAFRTPKPARTKHLLDISVNRLCSGRYRVTVNGKTLGPAKDLRHALPALDFFIVHKVIDSLKHFLQLHAGAVTRDGGAIVLPGGSNCGKSTLTALFVQKGFRFLTDELALIDPQTLRVYPFPRNLIFKKERSPRLSFLKPKRPWHVSITGERVVYVPPESIRKGAIGQACPLRAMVFPFFSRKRKPGLTPLDVAHTFFYLMHNTHYLPHRAQAGFDLFAKIIQKVPSYLLIMKDPQQAVREVLPLFRKGRYARKVVTGRGFPKRGMA